MKNQKKTIEEQGKKQVRTLKVLKPHIQKLTIKNVTPENIWSEEAKNGPNKIQEIEKKVDREKLYCRANEYIYNFKNFER